MNIEIEKLQDGEGHWYWIPKDRVNDFEKAVDFLSGKDYLDFEDEFNEFIDAYDKYRTGGDPSLTPDIFLP